jgi:hypothetical protein
MPWSTNATSTATVPATKAPTMGTNAPRKTSTPIANTNCTCRIDAAIITPTASVTATITVARTNWVSEIQATRPELSTRDRAARGAIRTTQAQMRSPSARKKYVENSTRNSPASTCPRADPTCVAWLRTLPDFACSASLSWRFWM